MKSKLFFLAFLVSAFRLIGQNVPMQLRYGLVRVNNNLSVDQTETNVAEWLGYVVSVCDSEIFRSFENIRNPSGEDKIFFENFKYPDSLLPQKNILETLEWHDLVNLKNGFQFKYTDCSNYKQSLPINSNYFADKNSEERLDYLLDLPVTGITYQQAIGYCKWRTKCDSIRESWLDERGYDFRLPTLAEYALMNENVDSIPAKTKNEKLYNGFNYRGLNFSRGDTITNNSAGKNLISIWQFHWSELGLYDIQGNAAEMTNVEGVACGGSYFQFAKESYNGKTQLYDSAQRWLGFRCVATRFENDSSDEKFYSPGNKGIILGYEGLHTNMFEAGIGFNRGEEYSTEKRNHDFIGYSLSFKKSVSSNYWGINNDFWVGGDGITYGINYNFNYDHGKTNHGIKPFIGLSFYNFTLCYGYNFHGKTSVSEINNHQITLRYYLPVIKNKIPPNRISK